MARALSTAADDSANRCPYRRVADALGIVQRAASQERATRWAKSGAASRWQKFRVEGAITVRASISPGSRHVPRLGAQPEASCGERRQGLAALRHGGRSGTKEGHRQGIAGDSAVVAERIRS